MCAPLCIGETPTSPFHVDSCICATYSTSGLPVYNAYMLQYIMVDLPVITV